MLTRDRERIARILDKVEAEWESHPDERLMQLLVGVLQRAGIGAGVSGDHFYTEDDVLEEAMDRFFTRPTPRNVITIAVPYAIQSNSTSAGPWCAACGGWHVPGFDCGNATFTATEDIA